MLITGGSGTSFLPFSLLFVEMLIGWVDEYRGRREFDG